MISVITPTHNPKYIDEIYDCLKAQSYQDWEWVVYVDHDVPLMRKHAHDSRVKYVRADKRLNSIGEIKHNAFMLGTGDYLVELDHDDLLSRDALQEIVTAFKETGADFVYSDFVEFFENGMFHYYPNWQKNGWRYRTESIDGREVSVTCAFAPSAASISTIYYAPNHVRVWRSDFYKKIGGHNPSYAICDDHEILVRTYLQGVMHHIDKPLYFYRMGSQNTFSKRLEEIKQKTGQLYINNIEGLILREGEVKGLPCYDLGGAFNSPKGWISVDLEGGQVQADLTKRWPFEDNSVMAFRAHDLIEHLPDKMHTMREIHRCLVPGGWAMIQVPAFPGAGAVMDPTHVSYWNEKSFWYYTNPEFAKYIRNTETRFMKSRLFTFFPSTWHKQNDIPYVKAELRALKGNMVGIPGFSEFR